MTQGARPMTGFALMITKRKDDREILDFDLGTHSFPISTTSAQAQKFFDLGLNWCFAFNQEEGVTCFTRALEHDPKCAMLHWGIAYAAGPFYNMPWCDFSTSEADGCTAFCRGHIDEAINLSSQATSLERALIEALSRRIQKPHAVLQTEFDSWDDAYTNAMRQVIIDFPSNLDVIALSVEAMMTRTPWRMWDVHTGKPPCGADTLEAISLCEGAILLADESNLPQHPAILHLHIHLLEMSDAPERAMDSAARLDGLCPDAGHIHHMPGHIYVLCGAYEKAKECGEKAISVNRKYLAYAGPHNYYTTARCHDLHLMVYSCMLLGQFTPALAAADEICANLTPDVIDLPDKPFIAATMEGYHSMWMHVLVRFGKWQTIINTSPPPDPSLYCVTAAMHHYARAVAHATLEHETEAEQEKEKFYDSLQRISPDRKFFNNTALAILGVGEAMMLGELEYHKGNYETAFRHLRESVRRCDQLYYSEPWPWMHPPRHALGALLLAQDQHAEAEAVYRADLGLSADAYRCAQHRENVWALHGLVECLRQRGESDDEQQSLEARLGLAIAKTDVEISSSCCCRKMDG